jgi:hypothetical protein
MQQAEASRGWAHTQTHTERISHFDGGFDGAIRVIRMGEGRHTEHHNQDRAFVVDQVLAAVPAVIGNDRLQSAQDLVRQRRAVITLFVQH